VKSRLIIITGKKGIGKTVVCRRLVDMASQSIGFCGGVFTYHLPGSSVVVEDISSMKQMVLAGALNIYHGPLIGNCSYNPAAIKFRRESIEKARTCPLLLIDELGPLEMNPDSGGSAIHLLNDSGTQLKVAAVDGNLLPDFIPAIGEPDYVFNVTLGNRNALPERISSFIKAGLKDL
jgi:nucleoside-triphosphatase THEP1